MELTTLLFVSIIECLDTNFSREDPYHSLERGEQVKIFRLRTGHNRLRHHLHATFGIGETNQCPSNKAPMTTEHILQECEQQERHRLRFWPSPVALRTKLYGNLEELKTTAAFIGETGLDI